ncbi:MAG: hypothetical protein H6974_15470 [Gammaproteobacteria bacterium]|nr:hypothetical protein [Gammaproteobacteria bacterium]
MEKKDDALAVGWLAGAFSFAGRDAGQWRRRTRGAGGIPKVIVSPCIQIKMYFTYLSHHSAGNKVSQ